MTIAMSDEETRLYARDGYILRKGLLKPDEVKSFRERARAQLEREQQNGAVMAKGDREGKTTLLKMWTRAEDDQYGLLARDERMVDLAEDAIGKPIYLYSHTAHARVRGPQRGFGADALAARHGHARQRAELGSGGVAG